VLPVNEIFETIQGEGSFTGAPSVFIRLQGCPVGCPWCDTKHTWMMDGERIGFDAMLGKIQDADSFTEVEVRDLVDYVLHGTTSRHVVVTGGEPAIYNLISLTGDLLDGRRGPPRTVQIETSGTHEIRADSRTFVTVSPKVDMPGGLALRRQALARANEIKMPVGKVDDILALEKLLQDYGVEIGVPIWLQPLSMSKKATSLCMSEAAKRGWRVSIQTHRLLGLR
jgi:7-carboxy-7-deazaguanine synthase